MDTMISYYLLKERKSSKLRGLTVAFSLLSGVRAPKWTNAALQLARVPLCHRHLDSGKRKLLAHATIKVAFAYLQSRELQACIGLELKRQRLLIAAAGGSTRTLPRLFPRASPLNKRCSMVDCVPNATRTPPRVPLRARAEKSPHPSVRLEETACGAWLLTERS